METSVLVCPECGVRMDSYDPVGHALYHYPEYLDPAKSSKLAIKRQKQILDGGVPLDVYEQEHTEV
jgi:hypothetical protein